MLSILLPVRVGYILSVLINRFHGSESFLVITFTFIDSSDVDVRLTRRIRRDTIDKGRDIKAVLDQVTKFPLLQFLLCIKSNNI